MAEEFNPLEPVHGMPLLKDEDFTRSLSFATGSMEPHTQGEVSALGISEVMGLLA